MCKLREQFPNLKLSLFVLLEECPRHPNGRPLATSSLSYHLKGWEKRAKEDPTSSMRKLNLYFLSLSNKILGPDSKKKKSRTAQYLFFEHFLALWIDAAESERIAVTDDIIRSQSKTIQKELLNAGVPENYESFELSGGWLTNFKGGTISVA